MQAFETIAEAMLALIVRKREPRERGQCGDMEVGTPNITRSQA